MPLLYSSDDADHGTRRARNHEHSDKSGRYVDEDELGSYTTRVAELEKK